MERARKWVMIPSDTEKTANESNSEEKAGSSVSKSDVSLIIKFAKNRFVDDDGHLLNKKTCLNDSNILDCILLQNKAKHYNRFLELKAQVSKSNSEEPKLIAKKRAKPAAIKKASGWAWDDDE